MRSPQSHESEHGNAQFDGQAGVPSYGDRVPRHRLTAARVCAGSANVDALYSSNLRPQSFSQGDSEGKRQSWSGFSKLSLRLCSAVPPNE